MSEAVDFEFECYAVPMGYINVVMGYIYTIDSPETVATVLFEIGHEDARIYHGSVLLNTHMTATDGKYIIISLAACLLVHYIQVIQ